MVQKEDQVEEDGEDRAISEELKYNQQKLEKAILENNQVKKTDSDCSFEMPFDESDEEQYVNSELAKSLWQVRELKRV